jgi:CheY-like chemotaxis protein
MPGSRMILIVDDDADVRDAISDALSDEGFRVACAGDGAEAIDLFEIGPLPDLVLLDWVMPGMDGAAFLREVAKVPGWAEIPLILFTAMNASEHPPGHRVLRKPLDLDELIWSVTEVCPAVWSDAEELGTDRTSILDLDDASSANAPEEQTTRELCAACGARAAARCPQCGRAFCKACIGGDASHGAHGKPIRN